MLLGGLWHGASWTFVLWGAYHGILLIVHRLIQNRKRIPLHLPTKSDGIILHVFKVAIFFQFTCIGWLIFRAQGGHALKDHVARIFQAENWFNISEVNVRLILTLGIVTLALDLWTVLFPRVRERGMPIWVLSTGWTLIAICIVVLAPTSIGSFIYFQF
jgi:alginate O-acetyltransferase complex protein AlgI